MLVPQIRGLNGTFARSRRVVGYARATDAPSKTTRDEANIPKIDRKEGLGESKGVKEQTKLAEELRGAGQRFYMHGT